MIDLSKTTLVGVDGCHGGWLAVIQEPGRALQARILTRLDELMAAVPASVQVAVDIPIGLPERGPRVCEAEARRLLGKPRSSSVFPVPPRACLDVQAREDGTAIWMRIDGKKMNCQTFAIFPKIREVDEYLTPNLSMLDEIVEVHLELSFRAWNGDVAMGAKRGSTEGAVSRKALIDRLWPAEVDRLHEALRGQDYQRDDLHDAFAALWSVRRWVSGTAEIVGDRSARDQKGLPMRMVV